MSNAKRPWVQRAIYARTVKIASVYALRIYCRICVCATRDHERAVQRRDPKGVMARRFPRRSISIQDIGMSDKAKGDLQAESRRTITKSRQRFHRPPVFVVARSACNEVIKSPDIPARKCFWFNIKNSLHPISGGAPRNLCKHPNISACILRTHIL